ncbi:MAG: hypothetical protein FWD82_02040 [Defluviitaleaceae bacterium]|nr:hypothetical protein [Defluviitaleaceae bacterium]
MFWKKQKTIKVAIVPVSVIFELIQSLLDIDAPVLNLKISYNDNIYRIGIASDYNKRKNVFFDTVFFVSDDCKRPWESGLNYDTFDELKRSAKLSGMLLADIKDEITILEDEDCGCPSNVTQLEPYTVEVDKINYAK